MTLMALQVLLLLGFQAIFGYVYSALAILVGAFMVGLALGSWWSLRRPEPRSGSSRETDLRRLASLYEVQLEYPLNEILTCDLYAIKGYGNLIVEVETGYIPPENALAPLTYTTARLASKIIRYSSFAGKFALGVPPHYILPFPRALTKPPRNRTDQEIMQIKKLVDAYYQKPPVTIEEIRNARIHEIYIIDVDRAKVQEIDPEAYLKRAIQKGIVYDYLPPETRE